MRRKPAEIVKLPGIAAAILPPTVRTFVVSKLAADARRDPDLRVSGTLVRAMHGPLRAASRRSLVGMIPELGTGLDHEKPSGEKNAETVKN
jgi:hypothetical protein